MTSLAIERLQEAAICARHYETNYEWNVHVTLTITAEGVEVKAFRKGQTVCRVVDWDDISNGGTNLLRENVKIAAGQLL